jgi:hypothetical protein
MRSLTSFAVLPLTLLGCTFHTYSGSTLPQSGFGMHAASAGQIAQVGGQEVAADAERDTQPSWTQSPSWRRSAGAPGAHRREQATPKPPVVASRETQKKNQARTVPATGAQAVAKAGAARPATAAARRDRSAAHEQPKPAAVARESKPPRSGSATPTAPRGARPDDGVVMLARSKPASSDDAARASRLRERAARGFGPVPREPQAPSSNAGRMLKSARDDRAQARPGNGGSRDASGTAELEGGAGTAKLERRTGTDAEGTAKLERAPRADERESMATK